jgi:hypothetical protein
MEREMQRAGARYLFEPAAAQPSVNPEQGRNMFLKIPGMEILLVILSDRHGRGDHKPARLRGLSWLSKILSARSKNTPLNSGYSGKNLVASRVITDGHAMTLKGAAQRFHGLIFRDPHKRRFTFNG